MSGVTLDELCMEVGVTLTQLNKTCTDEHIRDIALFLESWSHVAPHLGLSDAEVEAAKLNANSEEERRRKILAKWKAKFAFKAKYRVLVEALLKIGRADQAEKVCRVLVPQQPIEGESMSSFMHLWLWSSSFTHCIAIAGSQLFHRLNLFSFSCYIDFSTCPLEAMASTPLPHTCTSSVLGPLSTQSGEVSALPTDQLVQASGTGVRISQQERDQQVLSNTHTENMLIPAQSEHVALVAPSSAPPTKQLVQTSAKREKEVQQEIDTLKGMYDDLFMKTVESFKEKHAETPTFLSRLRTSIGILPSSLKDEHIHFLETRSSEIANATSVDQLFIIVSCYSDFYNNSLVAHIIGKFGNDKLKEDLQNYAAEFKAFCSRTNLSDFVAALTGSHDIPPGFSELVVRMGPQWELRTLKDLRRTVQQNFERNVISCFVCCSSHGRKDWKYLPNMECATYLHWLPNFITGSSLPTALCHSGSHHRW